MSDADVDLVGRRRGPRRAGRGAARGRAPGASVVVLEARDRVGGRTLNEDIGDGQGRRGRRAVGRADAAPAARARARARRRDVPDATTEGDVVDRVARRDPALHGPHPAASTRRSCSTTSRRGGGWTGSRARVPARGAVDARRTRASSTARRSTRGCKRNVAHRGRAHVLRADLRGGVGGRARTTSRCCTSSSTSARPAACETLIGTEGGAQEARFVGGSQRIVAADGRGARRPRAAVDAGAARSRGTTTA